MVEELPDTSNTVAAIRAAAPPPAAGTVAAARLRGRRAYQGWGQDRLLLAHIWNALTGKPYPMPGDGEDFAGGGGGERPAVTLADIGL